MTNRLLGAAALVVMTGCAGQTRYFNTNAELLDTSIAKASTDVAENVRKTQVGTGTIAVGEMRTRMDDNDVPQSLIVDRLVTDLARSQLSVIERDRNVLLKMIPEASGKEFSYGIRPRAGDPSEPLQYEALPGDREDTEKGHELTRAFTRAPGANVIIGLNPSPEEVASSMSDLFLPETFAKLPTADYLLVFRVIESGVAYGRTGVTFGEDRIRRRALTSLNYRLIDAKTGRVLTAGEAQGAAEDEIPAALKDRLSRPLYHHYVHNMPDLAEVRGQLTSDGVEASLDSRNPLLAGGLSLLVPGLGQVVVNQRYGLALVHAALEGIFLFMAAGVGGLDA
ncbi:MAG: hypothetical protein ACK4N5_24165, partial [Myxococcales bacterium]